MKIVEISSFSNTRVKFASSLKEKKNRDKEKKIFIEGYREILRAFESKKIKFHSIYISRECFLGENEDTLIEKINSEVIDLPKKIFEKISYRDRPDGLIAIAEMPNFSLGDENQLNGDNYIVIEGVEKPGNLGTILRTADGASVSGVIVTDSRLDIFNPNVIRSSTGILFSIPIFITDIKYCISYFKKNNFQLISLSPEANKIYTEINYKKKSALIFGNEQFGLSDYAKKNVHELVSIPMKGMADSLNLAMSVGIISYEVLRQRT